MQTLQILFADGLHLRPAQQVVQHVKQYQSEIEILFQDKIANAKNVIALLSLELYAECEIIIQASGVDASKAVVGTCQFLRELTSPPLP
jgi:phosphotransferase system HPr (HPr) family protein